MTKTNYLATTHEDSKISIARVVERLSTCGMQIERSFDLQIAREAHVGCACPHHGTEECDCQIVVLLVYNQGEGPFTLVAHSRDGKTSFSWVNQTGQLKGDCLEEEILGLFNETFLP